MKKPLHGALVAASLAVGSAQAESPTAPVIDATTQQTANICGDNQTNIVSAKQGHLGCKDIPAPGESIVHSSGVSGIDTIIDPVREASNAKRAGKFSVTPGSASYIEDGSSISVGPTSHGAQIIGILDRETWAVGVQILHTRELESAFFAAGFKIAQNVTGTFTVSAASESAAKALGNSKYDGKLRAYSASFGLSMGQAFARFIHERGKDITLLTEYGRSVQISQDDMNTFLRQTTVTTDTTTTTLWNAFSRETVLGGYTWNIGDNWQVTGSAGLSNDPLHGTMETAGFDVAYFGGDWKANAGIRSQSGQIISNGAATVQLNDKWSLGITGQYTPAHDSAKPNSMVFGVVTYSFDPVRPRYERPWIGQVSSPENQVNIAITNPTLHVQPRSLGEVKEVTTEVVTTDIKDTPNAPQALTESAIQTKINLDRTVTVTFRARSGWNYEYQVDGSSTGWTTISGNGGSFTTPPLTAGTHTLRIREVNPISHVAGPASAITLTLSSDSPTQVKDFTVSTTETTATVPVSLFDADGIKDLTCQVLTASGAPVGPAVTPTGGSCTISGLTPDTAYVFVQKAMAAKKNPDGSLTWGSVENQTPFQTLAVPEPPPVVNTPLVLGSITCTATTFTVGGTTTCSVTPVDPEGVFSVTATVDGTPVTVTNSSGTYSANLTGLSVGSHTLVWSATGKNPDGTAESTTQTGQQIITVSAAPVDHPETVTLPTPTITYSGISFSGGNVTDIDDPVGFTSMISYIVKDGGGNVVPASALSPSTAYTWQMQYTTYDGATNTLTTKTTTANAFTTLAAPDTTAPTQASSLDLGTFTLGSSLNQTVTFDEAIATAVISGLPIGVTGSTSISGGNVTVTLNVNPLTYTFTSATQSIPFTLTVTDTAPAHNSRANNETANVSDVAPNFSAQADATRADFGGGGPITPVTSICPTGNDQFGRSVTCTATMIFVSGGVISGGLSYNTGTNNIEGTLQVDQTTTFQAQRTVKATIGAAQEITNSMVIITMD